MKCLFSPFSLFCVRGLIPDFAILLFRLEPLSVVNSLNRGLLVFFGLFASFFFLSDAQGQIFRRSQSFSHYSSSPKHSSAPVYSQGTPVSSSQIQWHDSLDSGWRESLRTGRPMVIFITSDHCRYCDIMKQNTWRESSIRSRIRDGFVAIRLKPGRNYELGRVQVRSFPTTLVAHPSGKVIADQAGYHPPGSIHHMLSKTTPAQVLSR